MKNLLFIFLSFLILSSFAKQVDLNTAAEVGKNFYYIHVNQIKDKNYSAIKLTPVFIKKDANNESIFFAFNIGNNEGFIIVSGDDQAKPILGYSFTGEFTADNLAPAVEMVLESFSTQIKYLKDNSLSQSKSADEWDELISYSPTKGIKDIMTVSPLLLTTWNQTGWYNEFCPEDAAASDGRVPVGCVAVAMGQAMKYYNFPTTGLGSNSYSYWWGWDYGTLSANFGTTTYHWDEMPNSLSGQNDPVAQFLYHCGVAVEMYYAADGSGADMGTAADKMVENFRYSNTISLRDKSDYTATNWNNLMIGQLDLLRPVVYSGSPQDGAGHAWVMDGYQGTDYFHMNWGWGGAMDGYFYLDNLVMNVTSGGEPLDLTYYQSAIINIFPSSGYPTYCSGTRTIDGFQGTFEDGSGNQNYQNNQSCSYLLDPTCGSYTTISFDIFDLEVNDAVYVYDGTSTTAPLLATFFGDDIPSDITSSGNGMLLQFVTNGSGTATGWALSYSTEYCPSNFVTENESGTIVDGSGSCEYLPSTYCKWTIQPPFATSITIDFTSFNLFDDLDNVKIYDTDLGNLIVKYDAENIPTDPITINSGIAIVRFFTDNSSVGSGWSFNYNSLISEVEENTSLENSFVVSPNPFVNDAEITYTLEENSNVIISVTNILGNVVGYFTTSQTSGNYNLMLSDLMKNIESGLYFVSLQVNDKKLVKKVISYQ
ncbi:MAG: C10 family peptidase [Bacteroidales bacterium]|nr:C10 family peptidase [Bacteroidales bacterium]